MPGRSRYALMLGVVLALMVIVGIALFRGKSKEEPQVGQGAKAAQDKPKEWVEIGGVRRPASDAAPVGASADADEKSDGKNSHDYGRIPSTPADLNPQVKSVAAALKDKDHPERASALARPRAFDAKTYAADPQGYLNTVEPGRVFQPAQPGPGVKRLASLSPAYQQVRQGDSVSLRTRVQPGAPVTFTSFDAGEFSNRLTSITVAADEKGIAETRFVVTPGAIANMNILASSPVTSGQARFVVKATMPSLADNVAP